MKKWTLFLGLYVCLCLLAGCVAGPAGPSLEEPAAEMAGELFRVVQQRSETLLLAKVDGGPGDVYTLALADQAVTLNGTPFDLDEPGAYQVMPGWSLAGALVAVDYETVAETYPGKLENVTAMDVRTEGFDDLCVLYLGVLEDLWEVDSALNKGIEELGVDLSATRLSDSERAAVAWAFGEKHGLEPLQGTWDELADQGYIDRENLYWEKGCLFSITEEESQEAGVRFDAQKWRSGLGAYIFCDCTATQGQNGCWGDYTVGSEAIS